MNCNRQKCPPGITPRQWASARKEMAAAELADAKRDAAMFRSSFDAANETANRLGALVDVLKKRLDEKDEAAVRFSRILEGELRSLKGQIDPMRSELANVKSSLANAEFERDRLSNHPLMRFVRWAKGWE